MRAIAKRFLEFRRDVDRRECLRKLAELGRRMEEMENRIAETSSMVREHDSYLEHQAILESEGEW